MMKNMGRMGRIFVGVILLTALCFTGYAYAQETTQKNRAPIGEWAENPELKIRVTKVEEVTDWSKLPLNERFIPAREKEFERLKQAMSIGEAKIVFVTAEVKNITDRKLNIGHYTVPASPGDFWIKGSEGSEQGSAQKNHFIKDIKTRSAVLQSFNLPRYIQGGFPENALVSPNGSVSGRIMFTVPVWFKPTVFFRKAKLGDKAYEIIIQLSK